ncbi:MAG: VOC family protein [Cyclobacteriaceae bacterium]
MRKSANWIILISSLFSSCTPRDDGGLAALDVFCEMVASDVKPIALHLPMDPSDLDKHWDSFLVVAEKNNVKLHREDDFPVTLLFPAELTEGMSVPLIYRGNRLQQYLQLKADVKTADGKGDQALFARRFGRLLGYSPQGINELLSENSGYRNLALFGVDQQVTHLYYENLNEATAFYDTTLGFTEVESGKFQISSDAFIELHPFNEAHPKGQTKSTAIAFLTDQLPEWYEYVQKQNIPIKYTYKPREGGPHDGFVAIDPGGYLLEFEQFKQHPENELFMAALELAPRIVTSVNDLNFFGSITWTYHNDLLKMQQFYEEVLGYQLVADQGWTKIYQTSSTGFIGLVDERRGMEDYADTKAVEIEWQVSDRELFDAYARNFWEEYGFSNGTFMGPEKYVYRVLEK